MDLSKQTLMQLLRLAETADTLNMEIAFGDAHYKLNQLKILRSRLKKPILKKLLKPKMDMSCARQWQEHSIDLPPQVHRHSAKLAMKFQVRM